MFSHPNREEFLTLGLNFCHKQNFDKFECIKDLPLFVCKLAFKTLFQKSGTDQLTWENSLWRSKRKFWAIKNLTLLHDKSGFADWSGKQDLDLIDHIDIESLAEILDPCHDEIFPPLADFKKNPLKWCTVIKKLKITNTKKCAIVFWTIPIGIGKLTPQSKEPFSYPRFSVRAGLNHNIYLGVLQSPIPYVTNFL